MKSADTVSKIDRSWRLAGPPLIPAVCQGPGEPGLVSVLIPTFNRAYALERCIDSVLGQTYRPIEIIVVDDGSTDDTSAVISRYGSRVNYVFQENAGLASARNAGLALARGEFVAFQDSDDIWMPWKLEVQVGVMQRFPDLALVWTDMTAVDPTGLVLRERSLRTTLSVYRFVDIGNWLKEEGKVGKFASNCPPDVAAAIVRIGDIFTPMFMGNLVHPPVALMRRQHVSRSGGLDVAMTWTCEDYEFFWRVAREGPAALVEAPSMLYRVDADDQLTKPGLLVFVARGNLVALQRRLKADRLRIDLPRSKIRARMAKAHGWLAEEELFSPFGSRVASAKSFLVSLWNDPWHARRLALLIVSLVIPHAVFGALRTLKHWLEITL